MRVSGVLLNHTVGVNELLECVGMTEGASVEPNERYVSELWLE